MDPVVEPAVVTLDLAEESEVMSIEMATSGPSEIFSEGGGEADGREGSFQWSLNRDDQIENLRKNCTRASRLSVEYWAGIHSHPWFETVVEKLRADPCIKLDELEIEAPLSEFETLRSLDVVVMMGDIIMVQKVLANRGTHIEVQIDARPFRDLTALHLAAVGGDGEIVNALLQKGADVNNRDTLLWTPSDFACRYENLTVLEELLKKDEEGRSPLHVAAKVGNIDIIKNLPVQNANALDKQERTPLHHLVFNSYTSRLSDTVQYLTKDLGIDVKALDLRGFSVFYVAVLSCRTELVMALLDSCKEKIRPNEACDKDLGPPIQIAYEGGERFKDVERALMECDPVKSYMEMLYRDRQVYVDAANAILVGAALIASVTFASWLQPPLSYTEAYSSSVPAPPSNLSYVDVEHNLALRAFWIFNALSFYFAIGTVVCGARSVLPSPQVFIKKSVEKLAINLLVTAVLLACSVLFVIVAFGIAGAVVLTPVVKYQWYMIGPAVAGGLLCLFSLCLLFKSIWESRPGRRNKWVSYDFYLSFRGYKLRASEIDKQLSELEKRRISLEMILHSYKIS